MHARKLCMGCYEGKVQLLTSSNAVTIHRRRGCLPAIIVLLIAAWVVAMGFYFANDAAHRAKVTFGPPAVAAAPLPIPASMRSASGPAWTVDATTYGNEFVGRRTASGERYEHGKPILASNDWPLGTKLAVTWHGRTVRGVVSDRMAKRYTRKRIDLSGSLWSKLSANAAPGVLRNVAVRRSER